MTVREILKGISPICVLHHSTDMVDCMREAEMDAGLIIVLSSMSTHIVRTVAARQRCIVTTVEAENFALKFCANSRTAQALVQL